MIAVARRLPRVARGVRMPVRVAAAARCWLLLVLDVAECVGRVLYPAVLVLVAMTVVRVLAREVLLTDGPGAAGLVVGVTSMAVVGALLVWARRNGWWSA